MCSLASCLVNVLLVPGRIAQAEDLWLILAGILYTLFISLYSRIVLTGVKCRAWMRRSCTARTTPARGT